MGKELGAKDAYICTTESPCHTPEAKHNTVHQLYVSESHSVVSDSLQPQTVACQSPLSMEFSRQEYLSGLPFPSPGDLPNPGIETGSPALQADSLLCLFRVVTSYGYHHIQLIRDVIEILYMS